MNANTEQPTGFNDTDVFFDCPGCGKSLCIDRKGVGLIVQCPVCGLRMQVPHPADHGDAEPYEEAEGPKYPQAHVPHEVPLDAEVARVSYNQEDIEARWQYLEKIRVDYLSRFERIREEIALIQAGLDRMVDILQDISDRTPSD